LRIVSLAQWALAAGVVAATLLQFLGALYVREFAKELWVREMREEERFLRTVERMALSEERGLGGLPVIDEETEWGLDKL
jgi:hypothetical protein